MVKKKGGSAGLLAHNTMGGREPAATKGVEFSFHSAKKRKNSRKKMRYTISLKEKKKNQ